MPKKIHKNDIIGGQGVNLIEKVVLEMGCLWYPSGGVEAGIDGVIEIRDQATGEVTNQIVQVQSKASNNRFTAETEIGFEYLCDEKDLDYWLNGNAPVIVVRSRPQSGEAYWACVKDRFKDLEARKSRKIHFDKSRDRFDANARTDLLRIAVPKDSGVYLAPPPRTEKLYSNLLGISTYPEKIYIAQTELRRPKQVWDILRDGSDQTQGGWLLTEKTLVSFHDLSEQVWSSVCERGTVEVFDTDEFAFSDEDYTANHFVNLLYLTLKDTLWNHNAKYDKDFDYYHFRATSDLSPREYHYQSLEKRTSRTVFGPYAKKNDSSQVKYYRHNAFNGKFRRFEQGWYLEINPTYHYTSDGEHLYGFYEDYLKGIKRLENNQAILGQIVMWANLLSKTEDLFDRTPLLQFGELRTFDIDAGIIDSAWLKHEEKAKGDSDTGEAAGEKPFELLNS